MLSKNRRKIQIKYYKDIKGNKHTVFPAASPSHTQRVYRDHSGGHTHTHSVSTAITAADTHTQRVYPDHRGEYHVIASPTTCNASVMTWRRHDAGYPYKS